MADDRYDVAVIGGGPGGYAAAGRAAQLGMKTVIVERDRLGGICLNWGCIPTKALLESAHVYETMKQASRFGLQAADPKFVFPEVVRRSRAIADRMSKGIAFLMKQRNVTVIRGAGRLSGPGRLTVETDEGPLAIRAAQIILATGGRSVSIPGVDFDHVTVLNSTDALLLERPPESLIIIGAGAVGMEFADLYCTFGSEVTVVEMMPQVLPLEDADIVRELGRTLRRRKIRTRTGTRVTAVTVENGSVTVSASGPSGDVTLRAEKLLMAAGIRPNSDNIGLETAGVETEKGFVPVDERMRTPVAGIYAVGDLIGPPMLAHKATMEGVMCVNAIAGHPSFEPVDRDLIPVCTCCRPQVASVGLTEAGAVEQGIPVRTGMFPFRANGRSIAMEETEGVVKLVFDQTDYRLVGAHILHACAGDLIAEAGLALRMRATAHHIAGTIHAHPTLAEAFMEAAAAALGGAVHI